MPPEGTPPQWGETPGQPSYPPQGWPPQGANGHYPYPQIQPQPGIDPGQAPPYGQSPYPQTPPPGYGPGQAPPPQQGQPGGQYPPQHVYGQYAPPAYTVGEDQSAWYAQPGYRQPAPMSSPPSKLEQMKAKGGVLGTIAGILIFLGKIGAPLFALLAKFKVLLIIGKVLLTFGSLFIMIFVYSYRFGWRMAAGFVLSIFVHECGHAIAAKAKGHPFGFMVFIPFMGGLVAHKRGGLTVGEDAFVGIMGPVFGTLYAVACIGIYMVTKAPFWFVLTYLVASINLLNLLPVPPLDGAWITPVFSPKLLAVGIVFAIPVAIWWHNPFIVVLAALSLPRVIGGWKARAEDLPYFKATVRDRLTYALAYPGLALFLGLLMYWSQNLIAALQSTPVM